MSNFTRCRRSVTAYSPAASKLLGRDYWTLLDTIEYHVGYSDSNIVVIVPSGYITDGIFGAEWFQKHFPVTGKLSKAFIIHDYLYHYQRALVNGSPSTISLKDADKILNEALQVLGVGKVKACLLTLAIGVIRKRSKRPNLELKTKVEKVLGMLLTAGKSHDIDVELLKYYCKEHLVSST